MRVLGGPLFPCLGHAGTMDKTAGAMLCRAELRLENIRKEEEKNSPELKVEPPVQFKGRVQ